MKKSLFSGKSRRTKAFGALSVALIVLLVLCNLIFNYLGGQHLVQIDLTRERFYTLSDNMERIAGGILDSRDGEGNYKLKNPINIIFCADPDRLVDSDALRPTYFMALALRNRFENLNVETVNLATSPERVAKYKTTSLDTIVAGDIIVTYGAKYRVVDGASFWSDNKFSYDGEYRLASIMLSLTAINQPAAYFLTDHGESYYDPAHPESKMSIELAEFADLLTERGFTIKLGEISAWESVPEDCALLIINNPTEDFKSYPDRYDEINYISDLEKLDRYLVRGNGAIIINKDYRVDYLDNLELFAAEWGLGFGNLQVRDTASSLESELDETLGVGSTIVATYDTNPENLGMAYYEKYATLDSAPKMVFTDAGYIYCAYPDGESMFETGDTSADRVYAHFIGTSATAKAYDKVGDLALDEGERTLAAMAVRKTTDSHTGNNVYSYMFCSNSKEMFSNELIGNASYANRDILSAVIQNISRTESYAPDELGGLSLNSTSFAGKQTVSTELTELDTPYYNGDGSLGGYKSGISGTAITVYTVIVFAAPVAALVLGAVVFVKRKFL